MSHKDTLRPNRVSVFKGVETRRDGEKTGIVKRHKRGGRVNNGHQMTVVKRETGVWAVGRSEDERASERKETTVGRKWRVKGLTGDK